MPIKQFLDGHQFDPDTLLVMGVAFEMARALTRRLDRPDITDAAIARQIIANAQAGERNVDQLCDRAWAILSAAPPRKQSADAHIPQCPECGLPMNIARMTLTADSGQTAEIYVYRCVQGHELIKRVERNERNGADRQRPARVDQRT
jgi:hypothetical protein